MSCDEGNPTNLSALARAACGQGGGGGGNPTNPGGADTQVQFNDAGSFGGDAGLTYNKTTDLLTGANINVSSVLASPTSKFSISGSTGAGFLADGGISWDAAGLITTLTDANFGGTVHADVDVTASGNVVAQATVEGLSFVMSGSAAKLIYVDGAGLITELIAGSNLDHNVNTLSVVASGSDQHVQLNSGGVLAGDAGFTYDIGSQLLSVVEVAVGAGGLTSGGPIEVTTGDVKTHANAGIVLEDRASPGDFYRVFVTGGAISIEGPI